MLKDYSELYYASFKMYVDSDIESSFMGMWRNQTNSRDLNLAITEIYDHSDRSTATVYEYSTEGGLSTMIRSSGNIENLFKLTSYEGWKSLGMVRTLEEGETIYSYFAIFCSDSAEEVVFRFRIKIGLNSGY